MYLIIGGTHGIGRKLAEKLLLKGEMICVVGRTNSYLEELHLLGCKCIQADVTQWDELASKLQPLLSQSVKGLAYCPGSIDLMPLDRVTEEKLLQAFQLNVLGIVQLVQLLAPTLKSSQASVVLFSSIAAQYGFSSHTITSTVKGAVEGLMHALAAELAPEVRVNCIAPSLVDTPLSHHLTSNPAMLKAISNLHPIPRIGTSEEIASLAYFLLSQEVSWVTGQVFAIDGGRSRIKSKG